MHALYLNNFLTNKLWEFFWFFKIFITIGADGTTNPWHFFAPPIYSYNVMTRICGSIRPHCYENFEKPKKNLTNYLSKNYSGTRFAYTTMKYLLFLRTYISCHGQTIAKYFLKMIFIQYLVIFLIFLTNFLTNSKL